MRYAFFLLIISLLLSGNIFAQEQTPTNSGLQNQAREEGFVWQRLDIESSPAITDLLQKQVDQNRRISSFPGYRVQIYFGSGSSAHTQAQKIKADFTASNPDIKAYLTFKSPDFIIRIGDFRTKSEALKVQKMLLARYPSSFIVADEINFPELISDTTVNY